MEFRILGPLEVHGDDGALNVVGAKQRALLAVLLLHANEVVPSERLADLLWGDETPSAAVKTVQVHVSRLRKALGGDGVLQTRAGGYVLQVAPGDVDLQRFEELAARARRLRARGDAREARLALEDALSLWRGPPLADFAYEPFAQTDIARLEELHEAVLEDRIEVDLELGEHASLVGELEALITGHPLRERLRGQLMLALYRCGRQAEALDAYRRAREALVDELGIEPGRGLQELEQAILRQDPALDAPAVPAGGQRPGRRAAGLFVGREPELAELEAGLEDALAGRGRLFLIAGAAGLGKTRLADELASRAKERGARILWGRCWKAGSAPAYWPWTQALRSLAHEAPRLDGSLDDETRFRLFAETAAFLRSASEQRPLVLVLDDLHAADDASLLLLEFVAGELAEMHLAIVGTYAEPEALPDTLTNLARHAAHHRVPLRPFTRDEIARFVELAGAAGSNVDELLAETGGSPRLLWQRVRA